MSASFRLNRLFHASSGRCIDVAVDHGLFGEPSFLTGIEDAAAAVAALIAAGPDAIQLSVGQAPLLQRHPGREKPALVVRADVTNVYGPEPSTEPFSVLVEDVVAQAVRLDAACLCINLLDRPGHDGLRRRCVENIVALRSAAERAGMPVMIEPLALELGPGGYEAGGDVTRLVALVRQAAELGADLIKADPTDDLDAFHRVVRAAGAPVLVRGGGRIDDEELLRRTRTVLDQGARGVVYGRNVIQHADPAGLVSRLRAVVHGASA